MCKHYMSACNTSSRQYTNFLLLNFNIKSMSKSFIPNKYQSGDIVHAKENPTLALKIRRYYDQIYYCKILEDQDHKELVYFERELVESTD